MGFAVRYVYCKYKFSVLYCCCMYVFAIGVYDWIEFEMSSRWSVIELLRKIVSLQKITFTGG